MSESRGEGIADRRKRSEKEIADLVPYIAGSAIDAVRDALRRIVLENQDHSEVLDKLLPQLEQMPSKRSQALDWLDDELARLSDDDIISFTDRLKRVGRHELRLERESGGSELSDDPPTVEPEQPAAQPSRRRRWTMPATIAACLPIMLLLGLGWSAAERDHRVEHVAYSAFRADFNSVTTEVEKLHSVATMIATAQNKFKESGMVDRDERIRRMDTWFDALLGRIETVATQCEAVGDGD